MPIFNGTDSQGKRHSFDLRTDDLILLAGLKPGARINISGSRVAGLNAEGDYQIDEADGRSLSIKLINGRFDTDFSAGDHVSLGNLPNF